MAVGIDLAGLPTVQPKQDWGATDPGSTTSAGAGPRVVRSPAREPRKEVVLSRAWEGEGYPLQGMSLRIIAGDHRGRMLKTPPESLATWPYPACKKEALFSIWQAVGGKTPRW